MQEQELRNLLMLADAAGGYGYGDEARMIKNAKTSTEADVLALLVQIEARPNLHPEFLDAIRLFRSWMVDERTEATEDALKYRCASILGLVTGGWTD